MATLSVRTIAQQCLGLGGDLSVDSDLYGYIYRDTDGSLFGTLGPNDLLPGTGEATTRSLRAHLESISGVATDVGAILVGHDPGFTGAVTADDATKVQYAIQVMRDLYAQVGLGVRRITWSYISQADAGGYVNIADSSEAEDLTDDWNGPGGGIDMFFVQTIGDAGGWSNVEGPCDKDSKDGRTGAVCELVGNSRRFMGILLAHEVAHYLGLEHTNSATNLMGVDSNGDGIGEIGNNSTVITGSQGTDLRDHCSVSGPC